MWKTPPGKGRRRAPLASSKPPATRATAALCDVGTGHGTPDQQAGSSAAATARQTAAPAVPAAAAIAADQPDAASSRSATRASSGSELEEVLSPEAMAAALQRVTTENSSLKQQVQQQQEQMQQQQEQLQQLQQQLQQLASRMARMGINSDADAVQAQHRLDQVADGYMQQEAVAARLSASEQQQQEMAEQLNSLKAETGRVKQQVNRLQPQTGTFVAWAPADFTPAQLAQGISAAAGVPEASLEPRRVWQQGPATGGSGTGAGGAASSSGGSNGGNNRRRLALWVVTARCKADIKTILGGHTRGTLKRAGLPVYVDDHLSSTQRQRRKQLQPLRQQLRARGVRVRWCQADLQQRAQDQQGRWSWQQVDYPAAPAHEGTERDDGEVVAGSGEQVAATR